MLKISGDTGQSNTANTIQGLKLHCKQCTLYSTLHVVYCTVHILHCTTALYSKLYTAHWTLHHCTVNYTLHIIPLYSTLNTVQRDCQEIRCQQRNKCRLYHVVKYTVLLQYTMYNVQYTVYTIQCTVQLLTEHSLKRTSQPRA